MGYYAARTGPSPFNRTCMTCPRGSYSDTDTALSCTQCPSGHTTIYEGSTNRLNCQGSQIMLKLISTKLKCTGL